MKFEPYGDGEGFDALTNHRLIECFLEHGESGPHSPDGWILSHILNHCRNNDIAFTLVFKPKIGYYVKRDVIDGVIPTEMLNIFGIF